MTGNAEELKTIGDLKPAEYNPRMITPEALQGLGASLEEFGDISGIVWNSRTSRLVSGHQRIEALKGEHGNLPIKMTDAGPVVALPAGEEFRIRIVDWDEDTERAANITANNPHIAGGFTDGLGKLLKRVKEESAERFKALRMDMLARDALRGVVAEQDEAPDVPEEPISKLGDLWILGKHRLLCGDATEKAHVARVCADKRPFIMVTDSPYGVDYDPEWRIEAYESGQIRFSPKAVGDVPNDDRIDWAQAFDLFRGDVIYSWHATLFASKTQAVLEACGFLIRNSIIWRKQKFAISRGHYHWQHEPCWYAVRKGETAKWCGDRTQSTIWDIAILQPMGRSQAKEDNATGHGTQKPVECMARPIRNHGDENDDVYDPFLGSGTTLIAAEQLGRRCFAIEIEPKYVDVAVKRWENLTGGKAVLDGS